MAELDVDVVLLSVGPDLPYLTGYEAMPLERLTMLVLPRGRCHPGGPPARGAAWSSGPTCSRSTRGTRPTTRSRWWPPRRAAAAAPSATTWSRFLVDLQPQLPAPVPRKASDVIGPIRSARTPPRSRRCAGRPRRPTVAAELQAGEIRARRPHRGRGVRPTSAGGCIAEGHHASTSPSSRRRQRRQPPPRAGDRVIADGEVVLCDFGGTIGDDGVGYCSDITRCVDLGEPPAEVAEAYAVLSRPRRRRRAAVGTPCEEVDAAARRIITEAGYGEQFIHRTGHGIGIEEHEDPYIVAGNRTPLAAGHAFSIEPGIYVPGASASASRTSSSPPTPAPSPQPGRPRPRPRRRLAVVGAPYSRPVIRLDAATVLLQWAVGGLLFLWVTTGGARSARLRLAAPRHLRPDGRGRGRRAA